MFLSETNKWENGEQKVGQEELICVHRWYPAAPVRAKASSI